MWGVKSYPRTLRWTAAGIDSVTTPAMIYGTQSKMLRCCGDVLEELDDVVMDSSTKNNGAIALRALRA